MEVWECHTPIFVKPVGNSIACRQKLTLLSSLVGNRSSFIGYRSSFIGYRSSFIGYRSSFIGNRSSFFGNSGTFSALGVKVCCYPPPTRSLSARHCSGTSLMFNEIQRFFQNIVLFLHSEIFLCTYQKYTNFSM